MSEDSKENCIFIILLSLPSLPPFLPHLLSYTPKWITVKGNNHSTRALEPEVNALSPPSVLYIFWTTSKKPVYCV